MRWDLNRLLSPTDAEDFVAHFWEKAHFRVHRTDPGYFEDLFTLADLDDILAHTGLWTPGTVHPRFPRR